MDLHVGRLRPLYLDDGLISVKQHLRWGLVDGGLSVHETGFTEFDDRRGSLDDHVRWCLVEHDVGLALLYDNRGWLGVDLYYRWSLRHRYFRGIFVDDDVVHSLANEQSGGCLLHENLGTDLTNFDVAGRGLLDDNPLLRFEDGNGSWRSFNVDVGGGLFHDDTSPLPGGALARKSGGGVLFYK